MSCHYLRHMLLAVLVMPLLTAVAADAPATAPADELLSAERWQEDKYGVSLRPPLDAKLQRDTGGQALVRIAGPEKYSIEVYVRELKTDQEVGQFLQSDPDSPQSSPTRVTYDNRGAVKLDIESLVSMGLKQVQIAHPGSVLLDQRRMDVGAQPAALLYFNLSEPQERTQWVLGHAYMLIDDHAFAMLRLLAPKDNLSVVRRSFEAVVQSLQVQDPRERDQVRQQEIDAGQQWFSSLNTKQYQSALIPDQWLRVLDNGRDIGYVHITQKRGHQMNEQGMVVRVQTRVVYGESAMDSLSEFFLSDDAQNEIWSNKVTRRLRNPKPDAAPSGFVPPTEMTAAETGVRSGAKITLTRQEASSAKQYVWQTPPGGYISQVEVYLLPQLLPRRDTPTMGFYAYYPNTGSVTYRTIQVDAGADGAYRVTLQPAPNQPLEVSLYDKTGRLIDRTLPGGRKLVLTDPQKLKAIWKNLD